MQRKADYFTRFPNNYIQGNIKTKFGVSRKFYITYILIDKYIVCGMAMFKGIVDTGTKALGVMTKLAKSDSKGFTKSCGCYRKEKAKQDSTIHGMTGTKIHNKWLSLIDRENVCDEWKQNFINFYDWAMSHGYKDSLFLCRVELDKGFNPDNCKWMTKKEYIRKNQSKSYTYDGKTMTLPEWSEHYGINIRTLNNRINKYGMSIEEALTKPIKKKHYYTYNGETHSIPEWASLYNLKTKTLECRLNRGKSIEEALNM